MSPARRLSRALLATVAIVALILTGAPVATAADSVPGTATVTGRVTNEDGAPVLWAQVFFQEVDSGTTRSTYIISDGRFTAYWLTPGAYRFWIESANNTRPEQYTQRWYPGSAESTATPVTVIGGETVDVSWQVGAAGPGITGVVTDAVSGTPIPNAEVLLTTLGSPSRTWTNAAGRYRFSTLPSGTYEVAVSLDAGSTGTLSHAPRHATIAVADEFVVWNAALDRTGAITVTTGETGLDDAYAELYRVGSSWRVAATGKGGALSVTGLVPGDYELLLSPHPPTHDFVATWWPAAAEREDAQPITVRAGETTTFSWELERGATISGRVSSAGTDAHPDGSWVRVIDATGRTVGSSTVDADGRYRVSSLRAGSYVLRAVGNGHTTWEETITVALGQEVTRDLPLRPKGLIEVAVTAPPGAAPAEVISVYDGTRRLVATADVRNGTATTKELDAGQYYVTSNGSAGTLFGWYGGSTTFAGAQPLTVQPGRTTTLTLGLDAASPGNSGTIDLTLRGPSGEAVDYSYVELYDADGLARVVTQVAVDEIELRGLPQGEYRLRFRDSGSRARHGFAETWWGGTGLADAKGVRVSAGATTVVSATMTRPLPADSATITGTITSPVPALAAGTRVRAWARTNGSTFLGGTGIVDATGRYVIPGLLPGSYSLQIEDHPRWHYGLSPLFLPGVPDPRDAGSYVVSNGQTLRVDHALHDSTGYPQTAVVRGIVRANGAPAAGVDVLLTDAMGTAIETTDANGVFERDLNAIGTFTVRIAETSKTAAYTRTLTSAPGRATAVDIALTPKITTTRPALPKTAKVGVAVKATVSGWSSGVTLSYQWRRDGAAIKGATTAVYRPVAADRGKRLSVAVTGRKSGYASATSTSESRVVASGTLTTRKPTISGTRKVGETLTVLRGSWSAGATYSYRWYANGSKIPGATRKTYTLTRREAGDVISVRVTASKSGYTTASRLSDATGRVRR